MQFFLADSLADITTEGQTYNYWSEFVNMLLMLAFILILIFVTVWALKKIMRSRIQNLNRSTGIKILERRALTPKASLYLIDILGKGVVISESQSGIQLITEFSEGMNIEELHTQLQDQQESRLSIRESLTKKFKNLAGRGTGTTVSGE